MSALIVVITKQFCHSIPFDLHRLPFDLSFDILGTDVFFERRQVVAQNSTVGAARAMKAWRLVSI